MTDLELLKQNASEAIGRARQAWAQIDVAMGMGATDPPAHLADQFTEACQDAQFYVLAYKTTEHDGR